MVLFVTGLCRRHCFYCPLSDKRAGKDLAYANERPVKSIRDILEEAKSMDALGTGITGGDPSLRFRRVLTYLRRLKQEFGPDHHVHMYCCGELSRSQLLRLKREGLDEIRFHTWSAEPVKLALEVGLNAGVEIPAIPGDYQRIVSLLTELEKIKCNFFNLNELEFSDTNLAQLRARGFELRSSTSMAVKGSEEEAIRVLRWSAKNTKLNIHYCPSALKDSVQLRNRLKRKAKNVARAHEAITPDGLLVKGVILNLPVEKLISVRSRLMRKHEIPADLIVIDRRRKRIEMHWRVAENLAKIERDLTFALVEAYPTYDGLETTLIPL
ncbi:MAG: radical SAM protein [Candidatus Hadarchaeum sp.]|uniref:radical SAM protein n=1 Tax=Candidatus Hadarchaeum sp. TaxID=2883567 RepID=UPI003D13C2AE